MYASYATWLKANKDHLDSFIINEAFDWINDLQIQFDADKPLVSPYSLWGDRGWTSLGKARNTANKDSVTYRAKWKRDKHNVNHVVVQFNCFQGGGEVQTFHSSDALYNLFEVGNTFTYPQPNRRNLAKIKESQTKIQADAENKAEKQRLNKVAAINYFINEVYPSLSEEGESAYFSKTKGMPNDFWQGQGLRFGNDTNLKYMDKKSSDFTAVLLRSALNDEPLGLQLIYADGTKKLTYGTDKSKVPCALFGDSIESAATMLFTEGVADNLICLKAYQEIFPDEKVTGIFGVDANNLGKVVDAYSNRYPGKKGLIICDNDKWKYDHADNTGVLNGIDAAIKSGYRYVIPTFGEGDSKSKPTDISDLYRLGGLPAVVNQLSQQFTPPKRYMWPLQRINYIGLTNQKDSFSGLFRAVKRACHLSSECIPLESQDKVSQVVLDVIDNQATRLSSCHNFKQSEMDRLKDYAIQQFNKNISSAIKLSPPLSLEKVYLLQEQGVNVIRYTPTLIDGKYRIDPGVAQRIIESGSGLSIVSAPKDTGKTFSIIKPAIRRSMEKEVEYPTVVTHLVSLTGDIGEKCGIDNYHDIENTDSTLGLAITINSIIKPKFSRYLKASQLVVVDEIDAVFEAIETGTVDAPDREKTYKALIELLGRRKVIVTGADIDDKCLDKLMKTRSPSEITIYIANQVPVLQGIKVVNYNKEHAFLLSDFMESVSNKVNCILTSDNIEVIQAQNEELVKRGVKTLCITSNNGATKEAKEFFQNPNKYISENQIQALLYTPKLSSGLSIDIDHFKITYGVYYQQISVKGFNQMVARSRHTKEYRLAFPNQRTPNESLEKAQKRMEDEARTAYYQNNQLIEIGKLVEIKDNELVVRTPISPFTKQRLNAIAAEPYQKNPNDILLRLMAEGATITYAYPAMEKAKEYAAENKRVKEEYGQSRIDKLIAAGNSLNELTQDELTRFTQDALNKREKGLHIDSIHEAALIKHDYYRTEPFNEELIEFYLKDGWKECRSFEDYLTTQDTTEQFDRIESMALNKDISQLGNKTLRQYFNKQFMNGLGITFGDVRCDADGDIAEIDYFGVSYGIDKFNKNSESVQAIIALITKHKDAFNGCMRGTGVKFTDRTAREPMKFIGSWLKLFGFKLEALPTERLGIDKVMRSYIINDSEYRAFIVPYLIGRQRDGKNHLTEKKKTYYEEYIAGNAMPDAQNSLKPTQTTVDKPSTPYIFSDSLIIR